MRIDLQRLFSMVPREGELESLLGPLCVAELYEIHITVKSDGEIEQFRECCAELEVKPLVVQLANGAVPDDVMTSSSIKCTPSELRDECMRILIGLEVMGWHTVRCKVETSPFHSKVAELKPEDILPFQYFESHIPIRVTVDDDLEMLRILCERHLDMHMSANAFKVNDAERTIMSTYRSTVHDADSFRVATENRVAVLRGDHPSYTQYEFRADRPVVEFAIFDSNRSHDDEWIKKTDSRPIQR